MIYKFEPSTMATGLDSLDRQHENLFELSNRMDTLAQGPIDQVGIERALVALRNYGLAHFVHEERMMDVYVCPLDKANKDAHGLFVEKTKEWFRRLGECKSDLEIKDLTLEVNRFVGDWLTKHICRVDVSLKPCIANAGKGIK